MKHCRSALMIVGPLALTLCGFTPVRASAPAPSVAPLTAFAPKTASAETAPAETKETGADLGAQAAAEALKNFAGTDGAFLGAGLLKDGYQKSQDLATILLYPEDQVMIVTLSGSQVRQALERSVSLYPQPNTSFLQLAGFDVTFHKNGAEGKRIASVTINGAKLDDKGTYTVAMPSSLARGGLGYFKIWDKPNITKTFDKATIESVLKGKPYVDSSPHWQSLP